MEKATRKQADAKKKGGAKNRNNAAFSSTSGRKRTEVRAEN